MMERIDAISLNGLMPKVFVGENIPPSDVWGNTYRFERGISYRVEAASGAGKSSLCAFIYGARADYEGDILFNADNAAKLTIAQWQRLRRTNLAYLPQELSLFPELTAMQNIELKRGLADDVPVGRVEEWLRRLGIDNRRDYPVGKMSVGQQQRVAIIRAVCQPFDFILLDEPVSHLDADNNRIAATIIAEEAKRRGASVISTSVGNPLDLKPDVTLKL